MSPWRERPPTFAGGDCPSPKGRLEADISAVVVAVGVADPLGASASPTVAASEKLPEPTPSVASDGLRFVCGYHPPVGNAGPGARVAAGAYPVTLLFGWELAGTSGSRRSSAGASSESFSYW